MAELKPVYLVYGDDHARIESWRARLRARAARERAELRAFAGGESAPSLVVTEIESPGLLAEQRYVVVDHCERWSAADLERLAQAVRHPAPETVVLLIARANKVPKALERAVGEAGGEVRRHEAPKPWQMGAWVRARAAELGQRIEREAADELVAQVGANQMRLERELEKLALAADGEPIDSALVRAVAAADSGESVWAFADALLAGEAGRALELAERLSAHGESAHRLVQTASHRARELAAVRRLLDGRVAEGEIGKRLRIGGWRLKRLLQAVRRCDRERLDRALVRLSQLELELRGGRRPRATDEQGALARAILDVAGADA